MKSYPTCWIDSYGVDEAAGKGVDWVEHVGHFRFSQRCRRLLLRMVGSRFYFSRYGKIVKLFAVVYDKVMTKLEPNPRSKVRKLGYTYSVGSHFWMLPDKAIDHIMQAYRNDTEINRAFRHTAAPEESYFQTVLSTMPNVIIPDPYSQFENQQSEMDNPALRLIKWYENGLHTSGHPAIWDETDYEFIKEARALFGRKFEYGTPIIKLIDNSLR